VLRAGQGSGYDGNRSWGFVSDWLVRVIYIRIRCLVERGVCVYSTCFDAFLLDYVVDLSSKVMSSM